MKFTGWKLFYISLLLTLPFFAFAITRIVKSSQFDDNFTYHFDQALSSDDIKYSVDQADIGIQYLKDRKLTSGYTTITGKSSNEDIQLWYNSLLERSAYLHTLEATSTDDIKKFKDYATNKGLTIPAGVRVPEGISIYPYNVLFFVWELISLLLAVLGLIGIIIFINEKASV